MDGNVFILNLLFQISLRLTAELRGQYKGFPYILCVHTCVASATSNIPHQSGTFVVTDEPTLTS